MSEMLWIDLSALPSPKTDPGDRDRAEVKAREAEADPGLRPGKAVAHNRSTIDVSLSVSESESVIRRGE